MSNNNQRNSLFRRLPYSNRRNFLIETENHIQSIGDTPILEQIIIQPSNIINHNDYIYMIYLLILILFYIYYIQIFFQDKTNRYNYESYYFDNYEREIPRLLWFKKGYRFY